MSLYEEISLDLEHLPKAADGEGDFVYGLN